MSDIPQNTQIQGFVHKELDWFKHHLISFALVGVLVLGAVYGIESLVARHDHEADIRLQTIAEQMTKQNAIVQQQNQAQIQAISQQNVVLQQQLTALSSAIAARDAQLIKDRQEIKTLPPPALAAKWGAAANEPPPTIDTAGDFLAPLPLAQKSVDALIQVPVLQQDAKDLQVSLDKETAVANNNDQKYQSEVKAHQSDTTTCTADKNALNAQITDIKAQARKDKTKWAVIGTIFGFLLKAAVLK